MFDIIIKYGNENDAELIADLSRKTFYDTFASQNEKKNIEKFMEEQFTREKLVREAGEPWNIFFLAYFQNLPVGYVKLRESAVPLALINMKSIEIARIYTIHEMIGKGIGNRLMEACIDLADKKKKQVIWLGVWEKNQRAIDFYTKWGFQKFSEHDFVLGDDVQRDWLMKKELSWR